MHQSSIQNRGDLFRFAPLAEHPFAVLLLHLAVVVEQAFGVVAEARGDAAPDRENLANEGIFPHVSGSSASGHGGNRLSMVDLPSLLNGRSNDEAVGVAVAEEVLGGYEDDIDGSADAVECLVDVA